MGWRNLADRCRGGRWPAADPPWSGKRLVAEAVLVRFGLPRNPVVALDRTR